MGDRGCGQRDHCIVTPEGQFCYSTDLSRTSLDSSKKEVGKTWARAVREWWFELTLPYKLDKAERDWHESQPPSITPPVITHHEIDDELQTGESRKLGGALEIKAPWRTDDEQ